MGLSSVNTVDVGVQTIRTGDWGHLSLCTRDVGVQFVWDQTSHLPFYSLVEVEQTEGWRDRSSCSLDSKATADEAYKLEFKETGDGFESRCDEKNPSQSVCTDSHSASSTLNACEGQCFAKQVGTLVGSDEMQASDCERKTETARIFPQGNRENIDSTLTKPESMAMTNIGSDSFPQKSKCQKDSDNFLNCCGDVPGDVPVTLGSGSIRSSICESESDAEPHKKPCTKSICESESDAEPHKKPCTSSICESESDAEPHKKPCTSSICESESDAEPHKKPCTSSICESESDAEPHKKPCTSSICESESDAEPHKKPCTSSICESESDAEPHKKPCTKRSQCLGRKRSSGGRGTKDGLCGSDSEGEDNGKMMKGSSLMRQTDSTERKTVCVMEKYQMRKTEKDLQRRSKLVHKTGNMSALMLDVSPADEKSLNCKSTFENAARKKGEMSLMSHSQRTKVAPGTSKASPVKRLEESPELRPCGLCGRKFRQTVCLKRHLKRHESALWKCSLCEKRFSFQKDLRAHGKEHAREKQCNFKCRACGREFIRLRNLRSHMQLHTDDSLFKCPQCDQTFSDLVSLKKHMKDSRHKCLGKTQHSCGICDASFTSQKDLHDHSHNHGIPMQKFPCEVCGKCYGKRALKLHEESHFSDKRFVCEVCGKVFNILTYYKSHIRKHGKRFPCSQCPKVMSSLINLKTHLRRHANDKTYLCSYCGKGFVTHSDLKEHVRSHTGERPYACPLCGKKFKVGSHVRTHIKLVHKLRWTQPIRMQCEQRLQQHQQLQHSQPHQETIQE